MSMGILLPLVVLMLPLTAARFSLFSIPFSVLEFAIYVVAILFIWQYHKEVKKQLSSFSLQSSIFWVALIIVGLSASVMISPDVPRSLGILKGWFVAPMLFVSMVYIYAKTLAGKRKQAFINDIIAVLAIAGAVIALIALGYYVAANTTFDGRLTAFYQSPNQLAMFLVPTFFAALFVKTPYCKVKNIGVTLIALAILLTQSLGALIGIAAGLGVLLVQKYRKNMKKAYILGIIGTSLLLPLLSLIPQAHTYISDTFGERSSIAARMQIWESALDIGKSSPILGIGPGVFQEYYLENQEKYPPYLEWAVPHPHNIFLTFWLYAGIFGAIGMIALTAYVLAHTQHPFVNTTLLAIIAHGAVDATYWSGELSVIAWLMLVLGIVHQNGTQADDESFSPPVILHGPTLQ